MTLNFDWLSPLLAALHDRTVGEEHYVFLIPYAGLAYNADELQAALRERGIESWGVMFAADDTLLLTVRRSQALWAQHTLEGAGVPLLNPVLPPTRRQRGQSWFAWFWECLGG